MDMKSNLRDFVCIYTHSSRQESTVNLCITQVYAVGAASPTVVLRSYKIILLYAYIILGTPKAFVWYYVRGSELFNHTREVRTNIIISERGCW